VSLPLRALELFIPGWMARSAVRRLFEETASAFGREPPDVRGLDHGTLLERYVAFSAGCAEQALAGDGDLDAVSQRMWRAASALGASLRRRLGVRSRPDEIRAARIAYRMIGIDLRSNVRGDVVVDRCSFAERYSPAVCLVMSSLDAGLIAGLTAGGVLTFSERITEGRLRCLARISWEGTRS
jgi:hypothetical protein